MVDVIIEREELFFLEDEPSILQDFLILKMQRERSEVKPQLHHLQLVQPSHCCFPAWLRIGVGFYPVALGSEIETTSKNLVRNITTSL